MIDVFFSLVTLALRVSGWLLRAFLVLTVGCAAVYIVVWGIFWKVMGW